MEVKKCSKCEQVKPLTRFGRAAWIKSGYLSHCKDCDNLRKRSSNQKIREQDPEAWALRQRAYVAGYKERHPDKVKEQERARNLRQKFGITVEAYESLLASQGGVCAGCGQKPKTKRFAVDHDHSCCPGEKTCGNCLRGILCSRCNTALGLMKEDVDIMKNLIKYVSK